MPVPERGVHAVFGLLERDGRPALQRLCPGRARRPGCLLSQGASPVPGRRPVRRSRRSPVRGPRGRGLRVGMHICYDGSFPETGRVLALEGADLLVLPTNWPAHSECAAEHMIPCRAMENTVYMLAVNRVGEESGFRFIGQSAPSPTRRARSSPAAVRVPRRSSTPRLTRPARQKRLVALREARDQSICRSAAGVLWGDRGGEWT